MDSRLAEVADDIARHDSDKLLANGRFIAEKFAVELAARAGRRGDGRGSGHVAAQVAEPVAEPAEAASRARASPLTDEAQPAPGSPGGGSPGLDLAFSWLQRNLDELTEATRRDGRTRDAGDDRRSPSTSVAAPDPADGRPHRPTPPADPAPPSAPGTKPTPLLDQIGRDLTKLAAQGLLAPVHRPGRRDRVDDRGPAARLEAQSRAARAGRASARRPSSRASPSASWPAACPAPLLGTRIIEVPLARAHRRHAVPRPARGARDPARQPRPASPASSCSSTRSTCWPPPAGRRAASAQARSSSPPSRAATSP